MQRAAIAIIDLGGQYCHMIGRRLRDIGVSSEILPPSVRAGEFEGFAGIILSGGPQSVYESDAPSIDRGILDLDLPLLGICYGHQLLAHLLGADVRASSAEYGHAVLQLRQERGEDALFAATPSSQAVWMSHADRVESLPGGFEILAETSSCAIAAFGNPQRRVYGVQFHPEVAHTLYGIRLLNNFARKICGVHAHEHVKDRVENLLSDIRKKAASRPVFFFVSGGVDSTVAFSLAARALPRNQLLGVYVDTGLMRKGETQELRSLLDEAGLGNRLRIRDESSLFLGALQGIFEPEEKRTIIGKLFVDVQHRAMSELGIGGEWLLGQGTIYPDTVESGGAGKATALIKTHHNRCAEVRELIEQGKVIEPLSEFYKDEVRQVGAELGLPKSLTERWPFPGPGLAIRCLCVDGTRPKPIEDAGIDCGSDYRAVSVPVRSVGVQGDGRTYRGVAAVQGPLDYGRLASIGSELCNKSQTFNRVVAYLAGAANELTSGRVTPAPLSKERIALLREADHIVRVTMEERGLAASVWQFPVILVPVSFAGGESIVLRPVNSQDGMTASFARLPESILDSIAGEIADLPGIDAVFLDITGKPPATIEWE